MKATASLSGIRIALSPRAAYYLGLALVLVPGALFSEVPRSWERGTQALVGVLLGLVVGVGTRVCFRAGFLAGRRSGR